MARQKKIKIWICGGCCRTEGGSPEHDPYPVWHHGRCTFCGSTNNPVKEFKEARDDRDKPQT